MRILGIDHGAKRVGVAVSDPGRKFAFPLEAVPGKDRYKLLSRLCELVAENQVGEVVLGLPLTMAGERGPQAQKVEDFAERLGRKLGADIPIHLWDERLSSAQADRGRNAVKAKDPKDGTRDMMAAVVILQSFLDRKD